VDQAIDLELPSMDGRPWRLFEHLAQGPPGPPSGCVANAAKGRIRTRGSAYVAQAAEHFLGKEEVPSSNLGVGSIAPPNPAR
jgi:hypothetical protein